MKYSPRTTCRAVAHFLLTALICFACIPLAQAESLAGTPYVNSWVGNTYGLPADHIAHTIDNMYVTPTGNVATITGWDEGGANAALYNSSGAKVGIPVESGTGSWGRESGKAVFVDGNYLYQSMTQSGGYDADGVRYPVDPNTDWACVRRYNLNGSSAPFTGGNGYDGSLMIVDVLTPSTINASAPTGVVVYNGELYVSSLTNGQIKVYNASTMSATPVRTISIANPGLLDFDRLGYIWMLNTVQKKLVRFSTTGVLQSQSITFTASVTPTAFCVDKVNDRILVTNNGNDQNVLIYGGITGTPSQTGTFGNTGGINSGTAGVIAPLKFSEPKGVGIDSSGNIYIGNDAVSGGGARIEKYNSSGVLQWRLNGLIFTSVGERNPTNESEFYNHEFKFTLDLSNTTPGSEWSLAAMTLNKVKYPDDTRITAGPSNIRATTFVRNIAGRKLIYVTDMYGSFLAIYRFNAATDGETAIPSGLFDDNGGEFLWRDANGNGAKDPGETQSTTAGIYGSQLFPDANGGVWKPYREQGLRYFPLQGFDTHGNPQYTYASSIVYTLPQLIDTRRVAYDAVNDVLYAAGSSSAGILGGDWGVAGDKLVRYNNFLGTRSVAWSIALPFSATDPNPFNVKGFSEAGDYLFMSAYREGRIYVHRKSNGSKLGEILPTAATGFTSGWSDIMNPILATRRSNGEYLIFAEENGYGKINMYRWTPPGVLSTITASSGANGTVTPTGATMVTSGASQAYTITPSTGYQIASLTVDGTATTSAGTYTFANVTANHTIAATFSLIPVTTYTITATTGTNGTVTPAGVTTVTSGASQAYTITPATGYQIASLTVNGSATTIAGTYTFTNVTANHTIAATFSLIPATTYTVTGTITLGSGGLAGVSVSDGTRIAITVVDGSYTLTGVPAGTYTLTPTLPGYVFTPSAFTVVVAGNTAVAQTFVARVSTAPVSTPGGGNGGCGLGSGFAMLALALAMGWRGRR